MHHYDCLHQISRLMYLKIQQTQVIINGDSFTVFKVQAEDVPLFPGFLFFLCSLTRCMTPAPLKL